MYVDLLFAFPFSICSLLFSVSTCSHSLLDARTPGRHYCYPLSFFLLHFSIIFLRALFTKFYSLPVQVQASRQASRHVLITTQVHHFVWCQCSCMTWGYRTEPCVVLNLQAFSHSVSIWSSFMPKVVWYGVLPASQIPILSSGAVYQTEGARCVSFANDFVLLIVLLHCFLLSDYIFLLCECIGNWCDVLRID